MSKQAQSPSKDYIAHICSLYGDLYDDRIEDSSPPTAGNKSHTSGEEWVPGTTANHKSLAAFQRELLDQGINISRSKIQKILVTGGCWTTTRSREIQRLLAYYTKAQELGGKGYTDEQAVKLIAEELEVSVVTVSINVPYRDVVYKLEEKSKNAIRCARYQKRKKKSNGEEQ